MAGFYYNPQLNIPQYPGYPVRYIQQAPVTVAVPPQPANTVQKLAPSDAISAKADKSKLPAQFQWLTRPVKSNYAPPVMPFMPQQGQLLGINNQLAAKVLPATGINADGRVEKYPFKNDLRDLMRENKAIIEAIVIRTFNAKDKDKDGTVERTDNESGNFLNAINRLDELAQKGVNTIHLLPLNEPGKINRLGNEEKGIAAGSVYAPFDFNELANELDSPGNGLSKKDELKIFTSEAHKRGLRIMVDLPSCGSLDMAEKYPDWFLRDRNGNLKVPGDWHDIRALDPFVNRDEGIIKKSLLDYHKKFVDLMIDAGADGIRADVARAKPKHFWEELIEYSHKKDPNFGWLAETYVHEDASPMENIPADRPEDLLKAGFDAVYGQYHILHYMKTAHDIHQYIIDNLNMSQRAGEGKSLIGSFYTHDDKSVMHNGGALYGQFASTLMATLPMVNLYYINGFDRGDTEQLKIFDYVPYPKGKHPELYYHVADVNAFKTKNIDIIGKGAYAPLEVTGNDKEDKIMAFVRHYQGKTFLVIANTDMNARHMGKVEVPTLSSKDNLKDIAPSYGAKSRIVLEDNAVAVDLAPGRVHVFEINTPEIPKELKDNFTQNL